ncbi:hypothetical protein HID58_061741 [Brassica napus]|uniref:Uncharacterized protein n=1 Tax=Brassica napus TaxID=3708 RepID=A0ABQ7ZZG6_BRANA|nr:hypothetical protein HID58_061741 [Brassica napus]
MAQLPEGITELLHHEKLSVSLVEVHPQTDDADENNNNKPEPKAQSPTCVLLPSEELYKLLGEASEEGLDEETIIYLYYPLKIQFEIQLSKGHSSPYHQICRVSFNKRRKTVGSVKSHLENHHLLATIKYEDFTVKQFQDL